MSFRCLSLIVIAVLPCVAAEQSVLRVCADPNNMPFSNERGEGFENKLAEMIAGKLGTKLEYTWWSERKSFIRNSLGQGRCDVVMGVPSTLESITATKPYYRSTYVFVSRRDRNLNITSLDDPRLGNWRIGIHVVGDDYAPPAYALARRGITSNIIGFSLFGEYGEPNPPARLIDAVARGDLDVGIVWGPFAGYFAKTAKMSLDVVPVSPAVFLAVPFTYEISLGVRKGNENFKAELDGVLESESAAIQQILSVYGVPQVH
ncbi:MAG: substrate-binding domain-containing protein [Bryobacteraceae bacterium]